MHKSKVHIKKKERVQWIFRVKEKLILWMSRNKEISLSTQEIGTKMIFLQYLRNLHDVIKNQKDDLSVLKNNNNNNNKKNKKTIRWYFLECHVYWLLKSSFLEVFGDGKYGIFRAKKLMERWYLQITEQFLFWTFQRWKIRGYFSPKVDGKILFADYWKVLVLNFSEMEIQYFVDPKSLWKDDIYWLLKNSCFELFSYGK